jgi:hypothetical protein
MGSFGEFLLVALKLYQEATTLLLSATHLATPSSTHNSLKDSIMNQSEVTMLKNCITLGVAFKEAHGRFEALMHEDTTLLEFLETCANNHIHINAIYQGTPNA